MRKTKNMSGGYFGYGAKGAKDVAEESHHSGTSYKTSRSLIESIITKKEASLFSELETGEKIAITTSTQKYVDRKGKSVNLTPYQLKLVTAFAQVIDTQLEREDVNKYVNSLPSCIEDRDNNKLLPNAVKAIIDIPQLAKLMYSTNRLGGKQTDKVRDEIQKLSEIQQVFKFKDSRGGTLTIEAPIITLGKKIKYETKDGIQRLNKVEVTFEDVFVYEIKDKYSLSPITLLQLWNETGVQTELFTMLLFLLQSVRGIKVKNALQKEKDKRVALKKEGKDKEEINKELERLRTINLTYKESITSILERIDSSKYSEKRGKKTYLRNNILTKDILQAKEALLQMGIIKDYFETSGATGDKVCNFVINENWLSEEGERIKSLLPTEEQLDGEEYKEAEE